MQNTNCFWEEIPMYTDKKIWLAQGEQNLYLLPAMANRHGLILSLIHISEPTRPY